MSRTEHGIGPAAMFGYSRGRIIVGIVWVSKPASICVYKYMIELYVSNNLSLLLSPYLSFSSSLLGSGPEGDDVL